MVVKQVLNSDYFLSLLGRDEGLKNTVVNWTWRPEGYLRLRLLIDFLYVFIYPIRSSIFHFTQISRVYIFMKILFFLQDLGYER